MAAQSRRAGSGHVRILLRASFVAAVAILAFTAPPRTVASERSVCAAPSVHCGRTPTAAFDRDGRLWAAFEHEGSVYLSRANRRLSRFASPVRVNETPEDVDVNGENRPKIAFGLDDEIYVSWTRRLPGGFNGDIRFTRSLDRGRRFEAVRTINDDGLLTGHRFETLFVDARGNVYLAWLDKRDQVLAGERGSEYLGAAVFYTVSTDRGATFAPNRRVADNSCECCRIAAVESPDGEIALFFRAIFERDIRDHGFAIVGPDRVTMPLLRVTRDDWHLDACPHHGPAMLSAGDGLYDVSWVTSGEERKGIYYGRFDAENATLANLTSIAPTAAAGHPSLARATQGLVLVWKEFTGKSTEVRLIESQDDGAHWSPASTMGGSDHPLLISRDGRVFLSWHTGNEGLRIVPVSGSKRRSKR